MIPAFLTIFCVSTTVNFLAPLLIAMSDELGTTLAETGQLVVATALAWAIASPFTGLIGDRFGRRPVAAICLTGMGLTTLAGGFVNDFGVLVALRLITGIFGSGGPPSIMAGIGDLYPVEQRGRAVGWAMSGFSFGTLIGVPAVGALGGIFGWRAAFLITGSALLLAAVCVLTLFPSTVRQGAGAGNPLRAYAHLFGVPRIGTVLGANVFERITFMAVSLYFASFLIQSYGLTPVTVAPALAVTALGAILGTLIGGSLADRFPRPALAAAGLIASGVFGLILFLWPAHLFLSIGVGFGFGLTNASSKPPHFSLAIGLSEQHRGALLGLVALSNQVGFSIGAAVGGLIIAGIGYPGIGVLVFGFATIGAALLARLSLGKPEARSSAKRASALGRREGEEVAHRHVEAGEQR